MAEYIVEINQDNTIDLPIEVRDRLALEPGDKMVISMDNSQEHIFMGKLPMDSREKAREIDNTLHTTINVNPKKSY